MGCRCAERAQAISAAASALARGDLAGAKAQAATVGRTLVEDAKRGDLRRAASAQLSRLLPRARR